jgi:hypothetical protein
MVLTAFEEVSSLQVGNGEIWKEMETYQTE